jgi:protein-S-isoprenylcysteine O-methyltransferase Ste14
MYWTRVIMGGSFRLGAVPPGEDDKLVVRGPFALVRHPMYSAVLLMALGLGLALYSVLFLAAFVLLLPLIIAMIPTEEAQLVQSYGADYEAYQRRTKRLLPLVY